MKKLIKRMAGHFGYDIVRVPADPMVRRQRDLWRAYGIDLIFDVGANAGQYGQRMRRMGYGGKLVSFEPIPSVYEELTRLARRDSAWETVNTALGNYDGEATLHISRNLYSSSLLDMMEAHVTSAPDAVYVGKEVVSVRKLDSVVDDYYKPGQNLFVKIDTQGYERQVLEGSMESLERICGFQMELSLTPLYEGETLMQEMVDLLKEHGYLLKMIEGGHMDYESGELLQVEGYFFKSEKR